MWTGYLLVLIAVALEFVSFLLGGINLLLGKAGPGLRYAAAYAAMLAMLAAVGSGYQAALMAPTQILAEQHYAVLRNWLDPLGIRIALRTGARVVPLFALPLGGGRYRMVYEHPVEPPHADSDQAVREFTQRCTDVLEMYVRRHPELWLWMHRRWRENAPEGEAAHGMFPSADAAEEDSETLG